MTDTTSASSTLLRHMLSVGFDIIHTQLADGKVADVTRPAMLRDELRCFALLANGSVGLNNEERSGMSSLYIKHKRASIMNMTCTCLPMLLIPRFLYHTPRHM